MQKLQILISRLPLSLLPLCKCLLCEQTIEHTNSKSQDQNNKNIVPLNNRLICHHCHTRLPFLHQSCSICSMPTTGNHSEVCGECLRKTPVFQKTVSAFHYEPPVSQMITQLKFNAQHRVVPILTDYLIQKIQQSYANETMPEAIIAVPLYAKKTKLRGFNHAQLIAKRISQKLDIPMLSHVKRIKNTLPQIDLDSAARYRNLKNAFQANNLQHRHIAIVDDVMTTGATATSLSQALLQSGCQKIDVWSVARAFAE